MALLKQIWHQIQPFLLWCYKLGTPILVPFLSFFFVVPHKLQVGWPLHSPFQTSRCSGSSLSHIRTFTVSPIITPLLSWLCACFIVLLKDKLSPQFEVQSVLEQVFIKDDIDTFDPVFLSCLVAQLLDQWTKKAQIWNQAGCIRKGIWCKNPNERADCVPLWWPLIMCITCWLCDVG